MLPPMLSRSRKRLTAEERRAKILSAAVQAFAIDGYDEGVDGPHRVSCEGDEAGPL